jgi:aspartate/methionine/tyrosine aminotransferase
LLSRETLGKIGELAERVGARVLVDEVYLEMLFEPEPGSFSLGENFLVTSSLTKAYGLSGLRCGWILAAPELAHRIWRLNDLFAATAAHPAERMAVMAFDHLAGFCERAQTLLTANRALLDSFLDSRFDLEVFRPPAGTVVFPRLTMGEPEKFLNCCASNTRPRSCPENSSRRRAISGSGSGGPARIWRAGWSVWERPWMNLAGPAPNEIAPTARLRPGKKSRK